MEHAPCGLNGRLPDAHVIAAIFSGATVDMREVFLRTRAKAVARAEIGINGNCPHRAQFLNDSGDSGASALFALMCPYLAWNEFRCAFLSHFFPIVPECTLLVLRLAWPIRYANARAGSRCSFLSGANCK